MLDVDDRTCLPPHSSKSDVHFVIMLQCHGHTEQVPQSVHQGCSDLPLSQFVSCDTTSTCCCRSHALLTHRPRQKHAVTRCTIIEALFRCHDPSSHADTPSLLGNAFDGKQNLPVGRNRNNVRHDVIAGADLASHLCRPVLHVPLEPIRGDVCGTI